MLLTKKKKQESTYTVALVGNPNVGKSTVFNALTGMHQHTGNWPGKTVAGARGRCHSGKNAYLLVDTPGTYSLFPRSAEEEVTREYLAGGEADLVVAVVDAACLSRNLHFIFQVMAISPRVVLCVNLLDEAAARGIHPNLSCLEKELGLPVVGTVAREKKSAKKLLSAMDAIVSQEAPKRPPAIEALLSEVKAAVLGGTQDAREGMAAKIAAKAEEIAKAALPEAGEAYSKRDRRLDRVLTGKYTAAPIMLLLLAMILFITIVGANYPSALLSALFAEGGRLLRGWLEMAMAPPWLVSLLLDGVYHVLSSVIAVMLPPMAIFFPLFTLLEDSGYLPRIAYNLDRPFAACHACGKQALTMCMGFGCNAVGVTGCRIIDEKRERTLACLTNSFVPCNGRFPALLALSSMFFIGTAQGLSGSLLSALMLSLFMLLGIGGSFLATRLLSATLLRGKPSSFVLELPPYRRPQVGRVVVRSLFDRTVYVLGRAAAVALPAGCVVWIFANITIGGESLLHHAAAFLDPIAWVMGLDGMILLAFILALPANEIVLPILLMGYMAETAPVELGSTAAMQALLVENGWGISTALCTAVFFLFHWPCSTTLLTVKKESGSWFYTILAALLPTLFGFVFCTLIASAGRIFGF